MPISPDGKSGQSVKAYEPNRRMPWGDNTGNAVWYWGLEPLDEQHTRLITCLRLRYH